MHRDPVCGRRMNPNKAYSRLAHGGVLYLLCCPLCQEAFTADPDRYATGGRRENGRRKGRSSRVGARSRSPRRSPTVR